MAHLLLFKSLPDQRFIDEYNCFCHDTPLRVGAKLRSGLLLQRGGSFSAPFFSGHLVT